MKRMVSCLLAMVTALSLAACSKQVADRYCTNCGHGLAKEVSFCDECGAAVGDTTQSSAAGTDKTTTTSKEKPTTTTTIAIKSATTTKKPATTTTSTTKTTMTTTTKRPTTTTTTKKPTTTITTHRHTYSKYVCTGCGKLDKSHAYEWLIELVKEKGVVDGTSIAFDVYGDEEYFLKYDKQHDSLYIYSYKADDYGRFWYSAIYLDGYFYGVTMGDKELQVTGYLDAASFTDNSPISYVEYIGVSSSKYSFVEAARTSLVVLVSVLNDIAEQSEGLDMTIADLGFTSWK